MKQFFACFVLYTSLVGYAIADACPNFSGKYTESWGYIHTVAQVGCSSLTWTQDYTVKPALPDPRFPMTIEYLTDGLDRGAKADGSSVIYSKHQFVANSLVSDWRYVDSTGYVLSHTRRTLQFNIDGTQLDEVNVIVYDKDGTTTPWYSWTYNKVE